MEFFSTRRNVPGGSPQTPQGQERPPERVGPWRTSPTHLGPAHECRPPTRPTPAGPAEAWRSRRHGLTKVIEGGVLTENPSGTRAPPQHVAAQRRKLQLSSRSSTFSNLLCGPFLTDLFVSHVIGTWPRHILFRTVLFLMFFFFRTLPSLRFSESSSRTGQCWRSLSALHSTNLDLQTWCEPSVTFALISFRRICDGFLRERFCEPK